MAQLECEPCIVVLKKTERNDKLISLELVVDSRIRCGSKLEGIISDQSLASKFASVQVPNHPTVAVNNGPNAQHQLRDHAVRLDNIDVYTFIKVLAAIKASSWTVFTSNAFVALPSEDCVQTFYFEKTMPVEGSSGASNTPFSPNEKISNILQLDVASPTKPPITPTRVTTSLAQSVVNSKPRNLSTVFQSVNEAPSQSVNSAPATVVTRPPPGPAASSLVSISGGTKSTDSVHTTVHAIQTNAKATTAVRGTDATPAAEKELNSEARAAAVRRSSLASSLSSLSSGDAYLFARKVAERGTVQS
jgi:hypothetical protein